MKQYLELLKEIQEKGTNKPAARENMPGSLSYFGPQFRINLADGFPLLTTKKMYWKGVVVELLWFLRGDTNIKYLVDNGVNIWNEDAYNYYLKKVKEHNSEKKFTFESFVEWLKGDNLPVGWSGDNYKLGFDNFIDAVKNGKTIEQMESVHGGMVRSNNSYSIGDCGFQYGKVWRKWQGEVDFTHKDGYYKYEMIDQIKNLINSLKNNPESRRHVVTAIDPAHDTDLALYWCHSMFQFNCRPLTIEQRKKFVWEQDENTFTKENPHDDLDGMGIPKYYLDCKLYQRSADSILGVPFNIASYALLTEIFAKICNMIPGEFIHSFGDAHIYDNHKEAVIEQLSRTPTTLPKLKIKDEGNDWAAISNLNFDLISMLDFTDFELEGYSPQSKIEAELSTGLKK